MPPPSALGKEGGWAGRRGVVRRKKTKRRRGIVGFMMGGVFSGWMFVL
jgi:hypothetical protein